VRDDTETPHVSAVVTPLDVLVVDDDGPSREALCTAIVSLGHRCRTAASGADALVAHAHKRADVIVSDWSMPEMDGMELCRRVRALHGGNYTYLLFTSGHAAKRDFVDSVRAGADGYLPKPVDLDDLEAHLIAAARVVGAYRRLAHRNVELRHDSQAYFRAARVDPLTLIPNRLRLEEDLSALQAHVGRYGSRATVAMCDLDAFKAYNDQYGHLAGDEALRRVARAIRNSLRRADHVYRYGGEEFLVVLPEQAPAEAIPALERIRAAVEGLSIRHAPSARRPILTVSIGLAPITQKGDDSVQGAVSRADAALYRAKAAGGNAVCSAPEV
jgi:diguanylate cyclase (GGDEF)-like protein